MSLHEIATDKRAAQLQPSEVEERGSKNFINWNNIVAAATVDREEATATRANVREGMEATEDRNGMVPSPPSLYQENIGAAEGVVSQMINNRPPSIPLLNPRRRRNDYDINPHPGQV